MKYHPDRNPDDSAAEQKFKSIQKAYAVLSDKQKRQTPEYSNCSTVEKEKVNYSYILMCDWWIPIFDQWMALI